MTLSGVRREPKFRGVRDLYGEAVRLQFGPPPPPEPDPYEGADVDRDLLASSLKAARADSATRRPWYEPGTPNDRGE